MAEIKFLFAFAERETVNGEYDPEAREIRIFLPSFRYVAVSDDSLISYIVRVISHEYVHAVLHERCFIDSRYWLFHELAASCCNVLLGGSFPYIMYFPIEAIALQFLTCSDFDEFFFSYVYPYASRKSRLKLPEHRTGRENALFLVHNVLKYFRHVRARLYDKYYFYKAFVHVDDLSKTDVLTLVGEAVCDFLTRFSNFLIAFLTRVRKAVRKVCAAVALLLE